MNSVQRDQSGDELRRDTFRVATELGNGDIATEETFVDALERPQKSAHVGPHAFAGVDMHFPDAVTVIIPGPFMFGMLDSGMHPNNVIVA